MRETPRPIDDQPRLIERDYISFNRQIEYVLDLNLITQAVADGIWPPGEEAVED